MEVGDQCRVPHHCCPFEVRRSTACVIVLETCEAIKLHLLAKHVHFPQGESLCEVIDSFKHKWGFPQTIDGTHIPIVCPQESAADYYNRKGYYSILMQAIADFRGL